MNLVDLGLIYELIVEKGRHRLCRDDTDHAGLPGRRRACRARSRHAIAAVDGVNEVRVKLVWTPPWDKDRMSEEARLELGMM